MAYGARYIVKIAAQDGFDYRAFLDRHAYTGPPRDLLGASNPLRIQWGRQGRPELYAPIMHSSCSLSVLDTEGEAFAEIVSGDNATYRVRMERYEGSAWSEIWRGYVQGNSYDQQRHGRLSSFTIQAADGFNLLDPLAYKPANEPTRIAYSLRYILQNLPQPSGLLTRMLWRPWMPEEIAGAEDALMQVATLDANWTQSESRTRQLVVLKHLLRRFGLRLLQSEGAWWTFQRGGLQEDTADFYSYSDPASLTARTLTSRNLLVDDNAIPTARRKPNLRPRTRRVLSTYDFEPDLDIVVQNGSFEEAGATAEDMARWTRFESVTASQGAGGYHGKRVSRESALGVDAAAQGNEWLFKVESVYGSVEVDADDEELALRQDSQVSIPKGRFFEADVSFTAKQSGEWIVKPMGVRFKIGDYYLQRTTRTVAADTLKGPRAKMYVGRIGPRGAKDVPIIPEGAELEISTGATITLSEDAYATDSALVGELSQTVPAGETVTFFIWGTTVGYMQPIVNTDDTGLREVQTIVARAFLSTPAGEAVHGGVAIEVWTPVSNPAFLDSKDEDGQTDWAILDDLVAKILVNSNRIGKVGSQASMSAPQSGRLVSLADIRVGDGPAITTDSRLVAEQSTGFEPTMQGANTGWKNGVYAPGEASTGKTIDALLASTVLRAQNTILRRRILDYVLRGKQKIAPHNLIRHHDTTKLASHALKGSDKVRTHSPVREGEKVTILGASPETHEVTSVVGQIPPFEVTLAGTLASSHPKGTGVRYHFPIAQDYVDWDVRAGRYYTQATELYEGPEPDIEKIVEAS